MYFLNRYAYHLRKWALEGKGIESHSATLGDRSSTPIRLIVQCGSTSERCFLDMLSCDYIADLRAEIVKWAEGLQQVCEVVEMSFEHSTLTFMYFVRFLKLVFR